MEDCLHTSSENLSKLVSWAHSHGTICSLIPNLKHLLTEGAHGNLTAMWGCSAGHAYHWPLTATCKTGPKDRVCYQDSRSMGSDSLSLQAPGIPGDRFLARASKGKGPDCSQTRDSCDFSNCSEPSEVDDNTEDYNSNLFDIVCESSATDEDGDYELQNAPRAAPRKRGVSGAAQGDQWRQRTDETSGDPAVKKIKQEVPEDYYTVANAQLSGGMDLGPMSPSPKQATHRLPPLQTALVSKPSPVEGADLPAPSPSPSGKSTPSMAKPHRAPPPVAQGGPQVTILPKSDDFYGPAGPQPYRPDQTLNIRLLPPQPPGHSELGDPMSGDGLGKPVGAPLPLRDTDDSPAGVSSDLEIVPAQTLGSDPKAEGSGPRMDSPGSESNDRRKDISDRKMVAALAREVIDVKQALLGLQHELETLRVNLAVQPSRHISFATTLDFPIRLPLHSHEEFQKTEEALQNDSLYQKMVSRLTSIGGNDPDGTVRRMLSAVMTNWLACSFNWVGKGEKQSFRNTKLQFCLFESLRYHFKDVTHLTFSDAVKKWLRNAPERGGGAKRK